MWHTVKRFLKEDDGPTAVEYAVMLAFIVTVCIVSVQSLGNRTTAKFQLMANNLT